MNFIKITAEGKLVEIEKDFELDEDGALPREFNDFVHEAINCEMYEHAPTPLLPKGLAMLVDESGKLTGKKINTIAWYLANGWNAADPIVGDVLICGMHRVGVYNELDYCGLTDGQREYIRKEHFFIRYTA